MLAEEDADALLLAFDASAAAGATDELRTIEQNLDMPNDWRSFKRQYDRDEILPALIGAGYRGRDGARRIHDLMRNYPREVFERDRDAGRMPNGESGLAFRLHIATGGRLPSESYLAKLLI